MLLPTQAPLPVRGAFFCSPSALAEYRRGRFSSGGQGGWRLAVVVGGDPLPSQEGGNVGHIVAAKRRITRQYLLIEALTVARRDTVAAYQLVDLLEGAHCDPTNFIVG